ncbi:hypothetical protein [Methyloglobulus sp.]|jgi:hypothetical protein|uniref:hypothetical protein n=1 Tax=Methyloglobulus sp. TaxID=2518622 RepID=UPI0032B7E86C
MKTKQLICTFTSDLGFLIPKRFKILVNILFLVMGISLFGTQTHAAITCPAYLKDTTRNAQWIFTTHGYEFFFVDNRTVFRFVKGQPNTFNLGGVVIGGLRVLPNGSFSKGGVQVRVCGTDNLVYVKYRASSNLSSWGPWFKL